MTVRIDPRDIKLMIATLIAVDPAILGEPFVEYKNEYGTEYQSTDFEIGIPVVEPSPIAGQQPEPERSGTELLAVAPTEPPDDVPF